ncbi:hypothetical protein [Gemella cuniculi]|uniref:CdiA C-terminal domain-containing protein n=1 Tax=Gemella cuniculi TaxID=150240 RepID=UPI00041DAB3D|nr:hypothetical protein [Gemella cuniculi]
MPYKSVKTKWLKSFDKPKVTDMEYWEHSGIKYFVDEKHVVLSYSKKEKEVAEWLANKLGTHVQMVPRVNYPLGIPTPDYIIKNKKFDLKEIEGEGKNVIDNNMRKSKKQADNFILDLTKTKLSDKEVLNQLYSIYKSGRRKVDTVIVKRENSLVSLLTKKK